MRLQQRCLVSRESVPDRFQTFDCSLQLHEEADPILWTGLRIHASMMLCKLKPEL